MDASNISLPILRNALRILLDELISQIPDFTEDYYTIDDLLNQITFEFIKEDYKKYAPRQTIQYYINLHDIDSNNRKYTRAIQYAQHYRDCDNNLLKSLLSLSLPELEAQDMSGRNKFSGHRYTEQEFRMLQLQAECPLLNKLHGHQIDTSKKTAERDFKNLFEDYSVTVERLEPRVDKPVEVITQTLTYYGIETHFLIDFLYHITEVAEKLGFPKNIPIERILSVCGLSTTIPAVNWCPAVSFADLCIIPKWNSFAQNIFLQTEDEWASTYNCLLNYKRLKNSIVQRGIPKLVDYMHECSDSDKSSFLTDHYWLWDHKPTYEWSPKKIQYYRKLHSLIIRDYPKPHIK